MTELLPLKVYFLPLIYDLLSGLVGFSVVGEFVCGLLVVQGCSVVAGGFVGVSVVQSRLVVAGGFVGITL